LHEAQPVAFVVESHRLGIDGDVALERHAFGQVALMQDIGDMPSPIFIECDVML